MVTPAPSTFQSLHHFLSPHSREDERREQVQGFKVERGQQQQPQGTISQQTLCKKTSKYGVEGERLRVWKQRQGGGESLHTHKEGSRPGPAPPTG